MKRPPGAVQSGCSSVAHLQMQPMISERVSNHAHTQSLHCYVMNTEYSSPLPGGGRVHDIPTQPEGPGWIFCVCSSVTSSETLCVCVFASHHYLMAAGPPVMTLTKQSRTSATRRQKPSGKYLERIPGISSSHTVAEFPSTPADWFLFNMNLTPILSLMLSAGNSSMCCRFF